MPVSSWGSILFLIVSKPPLQNQLIKQDKAKTCKNYALKLAVLQTLSIWRVIFAQQLLTQWTCIPLISYISLLTIELTAIHKMILILPILKEPGKGCCGQSQQTLLNPSIEICHLFWALFGLHSTVSSLYQFEGHRKTKTVTTIWSSFYHT